MFPHIYKKTAAALIACLAVILFPFYAEATANGDCLPTTPDAGQTVYQEFPVQGPMQTVQGQMRTAWNIVWSQHDRMGLWIEDASFIPKPGAAPIQALGPSGISNIYVPYHSGTPRDWDISPWSTTREAILLYTGPCGVISGPEMPQTAQTDPYFDSPPRRILIKEIRERGLAWTSNGHTRRGEELLLWSIIDTGNYEYIVQYGFRDDGTITFRLGSTGFNHPEMPYEPHMHNALWYLDINVGHHDHNSVMVMRHLEPAPSQSNLQLAADVMEPFNNGKEGSLDWKAEEFTGLNIIDTTATNANGNNISYDLMPMRYGTARHYGNDPRDAVTLHDFWVTKNHTTCPINTVNLCEDDYEWDLYPSTWSYVNNENIEDTDVVIWYMSSNHHHPRDEDLESETAAPYTGIAQVMWSGFDLQPRNLMDGAPLYSCAAIPPGLVGWWTFEEQASASMVKDIQSTQNNGTPHPGPLAGARWLVPASSTGGPPVLTVFTGGPTVVAGPVGAIGQYNALSFNGSNDYVEINNSPTLNFGTGNFSADFWIKTKPSFGTTNVILDKRSTVIGNNSIQSYRGYNLYVDATGNLGLQLGVGNTWLNYDSTAMIGDGSWHHIAVTVKRTGSPKEIKFYVDGNLVHTSPGPLLGSLNNNAPLRFGVRSFELAGYFKGILAEMALHKNYVLTPGEVHAIYTLGRCRLLCTDCS